MFKLISTLASGIGIFIFALYVLNTSLADVISVATSKVVMKINKPITSFLTGLASSLFTQSSSAINSIAVQLADKGILKNNNRFYIVMGTNLGTTITAYLAVIGNINFVNFFLILLPLVAIILMINGTNNIGKKLLPICAFFLIFAGINIISISVSDLVLSIDLNLFKNANNLKLLFFGTLITAIFQSSSVMSLIIVMLGQAGIIGIDNAMFLIMGANLGTCSSAFLASIGKSSTGSAVAKFNFLFNLIGLIINIFLYYTGLLNYFINLTVPVDTKIALYHTFFNLITIPFCLPVIANFNKKNRLSADLKLAFK